MMTVWTSLGKSETDAMSVMWFSNSQSQRKVEGGKWCLDDDRKQAVTDTPMPTDLKRMQRFLGVGIFFI